MKDRTRAKIAVRLLAAARWLLRIEPGEPDFDTCVYCGATGCEDGEAKHATDCPQETGLYPVTMRDVWPDGPAVCHHCDTALWPGDHYALILIEENEDFSIREVACVGCTVLAGVEQAR